jgi:outer membrane protein TolC
MNSFILAVALILSATLSARELSLRQALELAQQHSFELKRARAEADASSSSLKQARAGRLPTLSASATAAYNSFVPSMSLEIPPVLQISREIGGNEMYQADLSLSVPLYTGGRIGSGIRSATAVRDYRLALTEASLQSVLYQSRLAFLHLYRSESLLDAAAASHKRALVIQGDVISLLAAGAADSMDILEANLNLTVAELNLKSARSLRRQEEITLLLYLGLPVSDSLVLTDFPKESRRETFAPRVMEISKPELRAADASVTLSETLVRSSRSASLPSIALFGGFSYGKPNRDFFNYGWSENFTVGATMNWSFNIGNRTGHTVGAQRHRWLAAASERDRLAERIDKQVRLSQENERLAWERYLIAQQRFAISADNYRLATSRRKMGTLSANRWLEIEAALREAESAKAAALADYYIARTTFYYAVGKNLLEEGF